MTAAEYQEFSGLKQAVDTVEAQAKAQGADVQTAIDRAKWQYDSDPANVKADNIAKQYARDMTIRTNATTMARDNLDAQTKNQESAMASFNGYRNGAIYVPSTHPQEPDAIYQDAVDRISKGLPDVPGFADYTPEERAAGSATNSDIAGARAAAQSGTNAAAADWATHGVTPPGTSFGAAPSLGAPTRFNPDNNPDYAPGGVAPTLAAQPPQAAPSGGVSGSILNQGTPQVNGNPIMGYGPITNNGGQWQDAYGQWHSGGS